MSKFEWDDGDIQVLEKPIVKTIVKLSKQLSPPTPTINKDFQHPQVEIAQNGMKGVLVKLFEKQKQLCLSALPVQKLSKGGPGSGVRGHVTWVEDYSQPEDSVSIPISSLYTRQEDTWSQGYRNGTGKERVDSLAEKMNDGAKIRAITVRPHKDGYVITDGTHRTYAAQQVGDNSVQAHITSKEEYNSKDAPVRFGQLSKNHSLQGETSFQAALPVQKRFLTIAEAKQAYSDEYGDRDPKEVIREVVAEQDAQDRKDFPHLFQKYKLQGETSFQGLDIAIENEKGSVRSGVNKEGKAWSITLTYPYGFIRGTQGQDNDEVDVFIGPNPDAKNAYIIHTNDLHSGHPSPYDEDKCMLGWDSPEAAKHAFLENYDSPSHFKGIEEIPMEEFKRQVLATRGNPHPLGIGKLSKADDGRWVTVEGRHVFLSAGGNAEEEIADKLGEKPLDLYHETTEDNASKILQDGFTVKPAKRAIYGRGVYFTPKFGDYGGKSGVHIHSQIPSSKIKEFSEKEFDDFYDREATKHPEYSEYPEQAGDKRLVELGYSGHKVNFRTGDSYIVVNDPNALTIKGRVSKLTKQSTGDQTTILATLQDLLAGSWDNLPEEVQEYLTQAILAGVDKGIRELSISDASMINDANSVASEWAKNRAAEMVGKSWVDGELVDNPNASMVISDTTRDAIRDLVTKAFENPTPIETLARSIQDAGAFSFDRASLIAKSEAKMAAVEGNWSVWKSSGLVKSVNWFNSEDMGVCLQCEGLALGSPYPLLSSPHPVISTHPGCRCSVAIAEMNGVDSAVEKFAKFLSKSEVADSGQWITVNGVHIHLTSEGNVDKGPNVFLHSSIKNSQVEEKLSTAEIARQDRLGGGINETKLLRFKDGSKGIFKSVEGEYSSKRIRKEIPVGEQYKREIAAWKVAKIVGNDDLVPASVLRRVETSPPGLYPKTSSLGVVMDFRDGEVASNSLKPYDGDEDFQRAGAFDYVIGNTDRHKGNWLVNGQGKLNLIDHGLSFPESTFFDSGNYQIVDRLTQYLKFKPSDMAAPYVNNQSQIVSALQDSGLSSAVISGVKARIKRLSNSTSWYNLVYK